MSSLLSLQKSPIIDIVHSLVDKHYPNVCAVILTGSQTEPEQVTMQSDIDIILLHEDFSGVTTQVLKDGKYKIDFTKVSIVDLSRMMIDYAYDHRGTLLHMLMTGIIIRDDHDELKLIQKKAKELFSSGNSAIENELRTLRNNLAKVKKNILKDLDHRYNFFLTMEFTHLISSAYILTHQGWFPSNSYRRTKSLLSIDKNAEFMDSLIAIVKESFQPTQAHKAKLINFIDRYLSNPFTGKTVSGFHLRFVINLKYKSQSLTNFNSKVLKAILDDPYLSKVYLYSQTHTSTHTFKYNFVLIFNNHHQEFDENKLMSTLYQVLDGVKHPVRQLHITSAEYLFRQFFEPRIYASFEQLLSLVNLSIHRSIMNDLRYDKSKFILVAQVLLIQLFKSLNIQRETFQKLMNYLFLKWRNGNELSTNIDYKKVLQVNRRIKSKAQVYYKSNEDILKSVHEMAWESLEEIELAFWDMNALTKNCNDYGVAVANADVKIDDYILKILQRHLDGNSQLKECYYFTVAAELLLNVLSLERHHFCLVAHNLSSSLTKQQITALA